MNLTVVIPFYNGQRHIERLLKTLPDNLKVIIIDDLSDNPYPTSTLRLSTKGYFTGAVNAGIDLCETDVLILNQDVYFTDTNWLNFLEEKSQKFDLIGEMAGTHPAFPNRYIHGTFMYIKRRVIDKIGKLDAHNFPLWGSTADYQLRAVRAGFKALPVETIPSFVHTRNGNYGTGIKSLLAKPETQKGLLIRTPPLVSVVITNYNYGRYLTDAVNSLIGGDTSLGPHKGQSFQGFEIIIVDDGSTDNSRQIIESLVDDNKLIKAVYQSNKGSAAACNAGIAASSTKHYISILDADDMMQPDRLQRMLTTIQTHPHSAIYDNIQYFANGNLGFISDWQSMKRYDKLDLGDYDFDKMLYKNTMHKGLLYPQKAWAETGGYPEQVNKGREDWAFNIALGLKGYCGINTGAYEYLYRREGQNRTLKNTTKKWREFFLNQLKEIYPKVYAGERPMTCCGRSPVNSTKKTAGVATVMLGQNGMTILEYTGLSAGDMTWIGPVTKTSYIFGTRKRGYVDNRDVEGLLNIRDSGKQVFKVYKQPVKPVTKPLEVVITEPANWEPAIDPSQMTVSELRVAITDLSAKDLEDALSLEKEGKNRATAIKVIQEALNA